MRSLSGEKNLFYMSETKLKSTNLMSLGKTSGSVREAAENRRVLFLKAHKSATRSRVRDENASLESHFERFLSSPVVSAYYALVPGISNELDHVRMQYANNDEIVSLLDKMQKKQDSLKEMPILFGRLQELVLRLMGLNDVKGDDFVARNSVDVMRKYWETQFKQYMNKGRVGRPLTTLLVLEDLLGLRLTGDKDQYDARWADAVWRYLQDQDHHHMQVIAMLDETEKELHSLYSEMNNVVSFKALVILTMWRLAHRPTKDGPIPSIAHSLKAANTDEQDWTLAYGTLTVDYPQFLTLLYHGWQGRPVHVNLYYIDFDATPNSQAAHIDLSEAVDQRSPLSFATLFSQAGKRFPFSYMMHRSSNKEEEEKGEVSLLIEQDAV